MKKYCAIFAGLMVATRGQLPSAAEQLLPGAIGQYLQDPTSLACTANDTTTCDSLGATGTSWECINFVCSPGCTEASECQGVLAGSGLNACSADGACSFDPDAGCTTDDDCPSVIGFTCDTTTGSCAQPAGCLTNADCTSPGLGKCTPDAMNSGTGVCVQEDCQAATDCITEGYTCGPTGFCIPGCVNNEELCTNNGLTCDTETGWCSLVCTANSDCGGFTNTCTDGMCQPACSTDADCTELGIPMGACDTTQGLCYPQNSGLPTDTRCAADTDCSGVTPNCNTQTNKCYPGCSTSDDCEEYGLPDSFVCKLDNGVYSCVPDESAGATCTTDAGCEDGYRCVPGVGRCFPQCSTDDDCVELGFNSQCKSYKLVLTTIKYCDLSSTITTEAPDDKASVVALWSVFAAAIASYLFM